MENFLGGFLKNFWTPSTSLLKSHLRFFLLISLAPLLTISLIFILLQISSGHQNIMNHINSLALVKEQEIIRWQEALQGQLELIASTSHKEIIQILKNKKLESKNFSHSELTGLGFFQLFPNTQNINDIFLLSKNGRVVANSFPNHFSYTFNQNQQPKTHPARPSKLPHLSQLPQDQILSDQETTLYEYENNLAQLGSTHKLEEYFQHRPIYASTYLYRSKNQRGLALSFLPIKDSKGAVRGILTVRSPIEMLEDIIFDNHGLGKSGRIILVGEHRASTNHQRENFFLIKNSFDFNLEIPEIKNALIDNQETGLLNYFDRNDREIIAVFRKLSSLNLTLFVQQERSEAYHQVYQSVLISLIFTIMMIIIASILARHFSKLIINPIEQVSSAATFIAAGNFSKRVQFQGSDEVAKLAQAFNRMAEKLASLFTEGQQQQIDRLENTKRELERSTLLLESTQEMALLGGWEIDLERGTLYWTAETYRIHEADPKDYVPGLFKGIGDYPPEDRAKMTKAIQDAIDFGTNYDLDLEKLTAKGRQIFVRMTCTPIRQHGRTIRLTGTCQDITQRKLSELEREKLLADLEEKNTELERFTYTVSHDLKSPLVTLKGFIGLLKKDILKGDTQRIHSDLNKIQEAASTMGGLLDDLLNLSKIGRINPPDTEISTHKIVIEVIKMLDSKIKESGAQIIVEESLPNILGQEARIKEVFLNIIENALKYKKINVPQVIRVSIEQKDNTTIFRISDIGIGIDPRYHVKVFDLFERLDTKTEGTGIGLAVVKRVIEIHGGRIWVDSQGIGHGTTICFTFPNNVILFQKKET